MLLTHNSSRDRSSGCRFHLLCISTNKFVVTLLIVIVACTTFAFASSQSGGQSGGEGVNLISGYDVSGVQYRLAKDASGLAVVEFDLNAPARVVNAGVSSPSGAFFSCQNTGEYHWVCNIISAVKVSDMTELKVIATGG